MCVVVSWECLSFLAPFFFFLDTDYSYSLQGRKYFFGFCKDLKVILGAIFITWFLAHFPPVILMVIRQALLRYFGSIHQIISLIYESTIKSKIINFSVQ